MPAPRRKPKAHHVAPYALAMRRLNALWLGHLPLEVAFWNWAVIGGLAVNISTSLGFLVLIMQGQPIAALVVGYVLSVPYNIVAAVGVWRSAGRFSGPRHWADLARLVTTFGMVILSVT
jgi:hypothetical protein